MRTPASAAFMACLCLAVSQLARAESCAGSPATRANCEYRLAQADAAGGRAQQAEAHYLTSIDSWQAAGERFLPSLSVTLMNLGEFYRLSHREADSEKVLLRAIEIGRGLEKKDPDAYPEALSRLGGLYAESERAERGRAPLNEAIERFSRDGSATKAELGYAYNSLGMIDLNAGAYKTAEPEFRKAVAIATAVLGEDDGETAAYQTNLGLALVLQGQFERAETLLRRARFVIETKFGQTVPLAAVLGELSVAAAGENKLGVAEDYARQAIAVLERQPAPEVAGLALARVNLAHVLVLERKTEEADRILPDAVSTERAVLQNRRVLADGVRRLAELRALEQSWTEAGNCYREAIGLYESTLGKDSPQIVPILREYAGVLKRAGASKAQVKSLKAQVKTAETRAKSIVSGA